MKRISILAGLMLATLCGAQNLRPSITWENICAHPAPLPVIGHVEPRHSALDKPSCWSVGCETMDRDYADFSKFKQYVGLTGVGYARLQSGWAKTEQKKGKYDFKWIDAHVEGLLEQGVHPWICLCYGNPIYSDHGLDLNAKLFPDGPIMDAWLKYVEATVKHFKGKVTMYEVWNEPDNSMALDSYGLYANLFVRTAEVIRKNDPQAKIAGFAVCSPEISRGYLEPGLRKIAEQGGLKNMDCLTYHGYWPVPEQLVPYVTELKEKIAKLPADIQLLQGETGCPGQLEYGHAMNTIEWTEYSQAKWDLRSMLTHWSLGCPYSVFTMVDLNYGWMLQSYGLVRNNLLGDPVYFRPKFHAVQHVTSIFTTDITPDPSVSVTYSGERRIYSIGLKKGGKTVGVALWFCDRRPDDSLERTPVSITVNGLSLNKKNAAYVDLLAGTVHKLSDMNDVKARGSGAVYFYGLPIWDSPVLLIDKNELDFTHKQ